MYSYIQVHKPGSLREALKLLEERGSAARIVAGCTDLQIQLRAKRVAQDELIDLSGLRELRFIAMGDDGLIHVGAATTISECGSSSVLKENAPMLSEAATDFGSVQIRNLATLGGNVANASPAGDTIPPLYVLDSKVVLSSSDRKRVVDVEDFFTGPGRTVMKSNEMIEEVLIRPMAKSDVGFYRRATLRRAHAISLASVALRMTREAGGSFRDARIALGAVAPTVIRARKAEAYLQSGLPSNKRLARASEIAASESRPITDIRGSEDYRRHLVYVMVRRGLDDIMKGGNHV